MARTPEQNNAIITGNIPRQLLLFFFPIWLGTMFQQLYNTVDTLIVGNFVGTQALAAVGATSSFVQLLVGLFVGLCSGAGVIIAQSFGAGDHDEVNRQGSLECKRPLVEECSVNDTGKYGVKRESRKKCSGRFNHIFNQIQNSAVEASHHRPEQEVDKLVDYASKSDFQIRTGLNCKVSKYDGNSHEHSRGCDCPDLFQLPAGITVYSCKFLHKKIPPSAELSIHIRRYILSAMQRDAGYRPRGFPLRPDVNSLFIRHLTPVCLLCVL